MNKLDCDSHDFPFFMPNKYADAYTILSTNRCIFMNEIFTKENAASLSALLLAYDAMDPNKDIHLYINSPGGDASGLTQIYDVIQMISAPVSTICMGRAYSAGAFLLSSGTKGKRYIMQHGQVMIHGIQCVFPINGDSMKESEGYYKFLNHNNNAIMQILAKHTGKTVEQVTKDCKEDVWLTAKEALNYGIVDKII